MKKGNKIIVAILIILILVAIAGGAFAYVYMATDILKTDKELFFKYFEQITSEEGFVDKRIQQFSEKKKQTPYENSGEITAEIEYPEDSIENIIDKVNDLSIRFSGKVDSVNKKTEQNIEIDYGDDVILPINYRQDGSAIGLQTDELSKKYIAVKNENLKQLLTSFGIEDVSEFPDTIPFSSLVEKITFTEEEKLNLKQIYGNVLQQNLLAENFSREKTEQNESYTLELSFEQIKDIIIKLLEATKENTLLIDKINELILSQDPSAEKIEASDLDDIIDNIKGEDTLNSLTDITDETEDSPDHLIEDNAEEDVAEIPNVKITLVQSNKVLNQIIIQAGEGKIVIEKNNTVEGLSYGINFEIKEALDSLETNSGLEVETTEPGQANVYFKVQYTGLEALTEVQENYEFGCDASYESETMRYAYKINNNTEFSDIVSIEGLDNDVAVFLNDYDKTQVTPFLTQVGTKLLAINKKQMEELGLKENENPLLYSNPLTMIIVSFINSKSNQMNNVDLEEYEIKQFNSKFLVYEGTSLSGAEINALIATVENNNLANENKTVQVTLDGTEISEKVETGKTYNVEAIYNIEGLISEMRVTTND